MTRDAAVCLIRSMFDDLTYQKCISRSVNFRYKDQTSIFKHPKKYQYLIRLLEHGGYQSLNKINANKMIIPILTHMSSFNNDLFHMALEERCKIINCIRHPIFILDWWTDYLMSMSLSTIDFVLKIRHKDIDIPFFAYGWEDEYLSASNIERSIKSISL